MHLKNHKIFKKLAYFVLLISIYASATSANTQTTHQAMQHAYGTHGMAIFTIDNKWYASHMPLNNSMHAHQIIMQVSISGIEASELAQYPFITFEPQKFDLHALQSGKVTSANGSLYDGHFERGGKKLPNNVLVTFNDILLNEQTDAPRNGLFWRVSIGKTHELLVHQIAQSKSYDQLVLIKVPTTTQGVIETKASLPITAKDLRQWLATHDGSWIKQLYLETADFQ